MSDIRLTTPEGYFERSLERTIASIERIRKRRKAVLYSCTVVVLMVVMYCSIHTAIVNECEKEYLAQQAELAKLDIFLEVNQ